MVFLSELSDHFLALGQTNDESALNALKGCYKTGNNQPLYL